VHPSDAPSGARPHDGSPPEMVTMTVDRIRRVLLGAVAAACIALQFGGSLALSSVALALWLLALLLVDRPLLRRLWLPRFWVASAVVVLASSMFIGRADLVLGPLGFSSRGLLLGTLMVVRGTFLFGLSLWASRALEHDGWLHLCRRLHAERLGVSVRIAFGLLPTLQAEIRNARRSLNPPGRHRPYRRMRDAAVRLVLHAARLAEGLAAEEASSGRRMPSADGDSG